VVLVPEKIPPVVPPAPAEANAPKAEAAVNAAATESQASGNAAVTQRSMVIQKGDTARQIAARLGTENRTAEQLMLALLRANPNAFVAQNINRLKAGAKLTLEPLPDPQSLSTDAAAREVARQAVTYAAWRRGLAATTGGPAEQKPAKTDEGRSTNKKVGPAPETSKTPASKDELKLGAAKEKDKAEAEKLAAEMQAKEDSERKAELAKNIEALKDAAAKTSEAAGSGSATPAANEKPAETVPAAGPAVAAKVPDAVPDSLWGGVLQTLQDLDTLTLAGAGALLVLVVAWLIIRRRTSSTPDDDAPPYDPAHEQATGEAPQSLGSREPSLAAGFEASVLATQDPAPVPSPPSVLFADSQLKPSDNLDAVAEADVYLAYGRDAQAEEILREALGVTPNKVELHQKLLDIFVLRGDADGFAQIAKTMSTYLDSQGPQWLKVCELGALLDGNNPLYHNHAGPDSLAPGVFPSAGARPLPMEFPAGLDLNLSKPVDKPAATAGQDFRPSSQVQPLGFEFSSQNLVLAPEGNTAPDTAQPWSVQAGDEGSRLLDQKIELAKEFIGVSDFAGARILLNEVIERAQGNQLEQAKQLLAQIA
jgi:pilus assembly protein FimV